MIVDRAWAARNTGDDPIATPPPPSTFSVTATARSARLEDFQREIIEFDSEAPQGREFLAFTTATGLSRYTDVRWPKSAPKTGRAPRGRQGGPLPRADVLLVTWTVDEGHALSRALTPGKDSRNDYRAYTHNYAAIARKMPPGRPARQAQRLGAYWTTTIGRRSVVVFKSYRVRRSGRCCAAGCTPSAASRSRELRAMRTRSPHARLRQGDSGFAGEKRGGSSVSSSQP
jgi:hypothetical protein